MAPKRKQQDQNHSVKKKKQKIREDIVLKPTISSEDIPKTQVLFESYSNARKFGKRERERLHLPLLRLEKSIKNTVAF